MSKYCLDSSAWLDGWARDYPPEVFPSLWEKLEGLMSEGAIICSEEVYVELSKKDDGLFAWLKDRKEAVISLDEDIQEAVAELLAEYPRLVDTHRNRSQADPFVIATAICRGAIVVTGEKARGKLDTPKIPDVCGVRDLPCMTFLEMLRDLGWRF